MKSYTRRSMLAWSAGAIAGCPSMLRAAAQITPEQQRILDCYPSYGTGEPVTYTDERLKCLEAKLQRHIPISFETAPGAQATSMLSETRQNGRTRFVIGENEDVFRLFESFSFDATSAEEILKRAAQIDAKAWLESQRLHSENGGPEEDGGAESPAPYTGNLPPDLELIRRELPHMELEVWEPQVPSPTERLHAVRDHRTGGFKPEVVIARLQEADWTKVPALLRYGSWNACPPPEVHVAVHRYWRDLYGIELVGAQADILEFRVANPPRDREAALALAHEQYAYCNDIVDQGVGDLDDLATALMDSDYWFFWWD